MDEKDTKDLILSPIAQTVFRRREETDQEGWMVAYADMITLLFIFFTLLLSISTINTTKFDMIRSEWSQKSETNLTKVAEEMKAQVEKRNLSELVSIDMSAEGLRVSFSEQVLFPSGESVLNGEGQQTLDGVATVLKSMSSKYQIAIEGHTDNRPIHTKEFASNWALSSARAVNVLHFLSEHGVSDRVMSIRGFADTRPMPLSEKEKGISQEKLMAKNRRVSLLIY